MPSYILKLDTPNGPRYLEWSTIVDAPVTWGMTLDEFQAHYRAEYGESGMRNLSQRMERVEKFGTSSQMHGDAQDVIRGNRAGKNETCLTMEQIVTYYAIFRGGDIPTGVSVDQMHM